jgi:hypothetical protein
MPVEPEKIWELQALERMQGIGPNRIDFDDRSLRAAWGLRFASGEEFI